MPASGADMNADERILNTVSVGGMPVSRAGRADFARAMANHARTRRTTRLRPLLVFDANAHALSLNDTDAEYRAALGKADILHADGGIIVMASRWLAGAPIAERSCTTDMFYDFAELADREQLSFFLLGATEEVNAGCAEVLAARYPSLRLAGRHHGYYGANEEDRIVELINAANPDVLWVGLGKPLEQTFSARNADRLNAGWIVTCGGCFNYVTGAYPRAPEWMRNNSLEWLHRAFTGPRRLIWRYLTTNPHAVWVMLTRNSTKRTPSSAN